MNDQQTNTTQMQNTPTPPEQPVTSGNSTLPAISSEKNKKQKNTNKIFSIIAVLLFILILGELGYVFLYHRSSFKHPLFPSLSLFSHTQNKNNSQSINTSTPTPINPPINGIGIASGFTVNFEKFIKDPTISGDKPNKNFKYIEFDMSVTNNTSHTTLIPGMFYFQDMATGKLFMPADIFGYVPYNWIVSSLSHKSVTIPGKNPLLTTQIPARQTVNNLYLIYQILQGEKGKLIWDNASSITMIPTNTKVASPQVAQIIYEFQPKGVKLFKFNANDSKDSRVVVFSIP